MYPINQAMILHLTVPGYQKQSSWSLNSDYDKIDTRFKNAAHYKSNKLY